METVIKKTIKGSTMEAIFKDKYANIRHYSTDLKGYVYDRHKSYLYEIVVRHPEGTKATDVINQAIKKVENPTEVEVTRTQGEWMEKEFQIYNENGNTIAYCPRSKAISDEEGQANAEFICNAVNQYDKLKADNEVLQNALKQCVEQFSGLTGYGDETDERIIREAKEAIKQSETK